jgi:phosphatidylglycerophosphate synthase
MKIEVCSSEIDRRPIAARHWHISRQLASWMARCGMSANAISLAGMACGIGAGLALATTSLDPAWQRLAWLAGATLIQLRLLANMLDGMVAIESGQASPIGELFNEVPDRISDVAILVGAGFAVGGDIMLGFTASLVAVFTAYVRAVGKAAGAPQEFCGPMAKQQRMFLVTLVALFGGLAPSNWQSTWAPMIVALWFIVVLGLLTAVRRLVRTARALRSAES